MIDNSKIFNEFKINKYIKDLKPGDKNLDMKFILIDKRQKTKTKNDSVIQQYLVADETGSVLCNFFDDFGNFINDGDICLIKNGYASLFKNNLILYASNISIIIARTGTGQVVKIDEFFFNFSEQPNMSLVPWKRAKDDKGNESYVRDYEK